MRSENDIGFAVRRLSNLIKRDVEKSKVKLGIDQIQGINGWAIDYFYKNREKDIFQKDFENNFSIRPSTASKILKTMEQKGLIKRESAKNDARLKKITLTKKAILLHENVIATINEREKRLRVGIDEDDLKTFFDVMNKLSANMETDL